MAFTLTTIWFLWQHTTGISWDFSVYVLNAKYFWGGSYFQWGAPPLASILLAMFAPAGILAEYIYIVLVSTLWLFACIRLANNWGLDRTIFYLVCLNPAVLILGLKNGTELLSLALITFFFAEYFGGKARAGVTLATAVLTRWTNIIFVPFLLLSKNVKKIISAIAMFVVVLLPWFAYSWIATGSPLTSIVEAAVGEKLRAEYIMQPINIMDILLIGNWMIPLAIAGLVLALRKLKNTKNILMLFILALALLAYAMTSIKDIRYLFMLILPLAYFSTMAIGKLKSGKKLLSILLALNIVTILGALVLAPTSVVLESPTQYFTALADRDTCAMSSNAWIYMNYLGWPADDPIRLELVDKKISDGWRLLMFKSIPEPDWVFNVTIRDRLPLIAERPDYWLFGDSKLCAELKPVTATYTQRINEWLVAVGMKPLDRCEIVLPGLCANPVVKWLVG